MTGARVMAVALREDPRPTGKDGERKENHATEIAAVRLVGAQCGM